VAVGGILQYSVHRVRLLAALEEDGGVIIAPAPCFSSRPRSEQENVVNYLGKGAFDVSTESP
jgi:hypothetical protein